MISGGGTGGHIFPALAIAQAIRRHDPTAELLFVGAEGRMEMEKVPAAGFRIEALPIAGLQRRLDWRNLVLPFKLLRSLWKARRLIREFKPQVVVGVGGYASGPLLMMAQRMQLPTLIQEQNSYAGKTNKLLARRARRICVAYEGMEKFFPADRLLLTGNPVRADLRQANALRGEAFAFFELGPATPTLLLIGGSLGARTLNQCLRAGLQALAEQGIQVIWQTGKAFAAEALLATEPWKKTVRVFDFIRRMDLAYAAADVVISRAGALSIAELCLVAKPCILVPSPNVAEDHQTRNAEALVGKQAAWLVHDTEAGVKLLPMAIQLLQDPARQQEMSQRMAAMAKPDADERIAAEIFALAGLPFEKKNDPLILTR